MKQYLNKHNLSQEYLREEELRLRLEEDDRLQLEDEKMRKEEMRIRVADYKRMRLEEEKMRQLDAEKKKHLDVLLQSSHFKKALEDARLSKRTHVHAFTSESNSKVSCVKIKKHRGYLNNPFLLERLKNVRPWKEVSNYITYYNLNEFIQSSF